MENKLQKLTEKLYNEGLSKGREEAEQMLVNAKQEGADIVSEAKRQAQEIIEKAKQEAEQLKVNVENEIRLVSGQMQSSLRQQIERMVMMQTVTPKVSEAWKDGSFIKELSLKAVEQIGGKEGGAKVLLPEAAGKDLLDAVKNAMGEKFGQSVEVVTDGKLKVPFRIVPQGQGYYVNFTDADFDALFKSYIRPKVAELLFGKEESGK